MLLTWLMLFGFELLRAYSQMLRKRRMSMKNEKELTFEYTTTRHRKPRQLYAALSMPFSTLVFGLRHFYAQVA